MSRKYQPKPKPRVRRARPLLVAVGAVLLTAGCGDQLHGLAPCDPSNPLEDCGPKDMSAAYDLGLIIHDHD
jgi:hypothetical protein